jgi:hypothetical protein
LLQRSFPLERKEIQREEVVMGQPITTFYLQTTSEGATTMSDANFMALAFKENLKKNPDLFTFDIEQHDKNMREHSEKMAKLNPPKPANPYEEYKQLRGRLYQLQQGVQNTTIYFNNISGTVSQLEQLVDGAKRNEKASAEAGNVLAEKHAKHVIDRLAREFADAKKERRRALTQKEGAEQLLAAFDQQERLAELTKQFS